MKTRARVFRRLKLKRRLFAKGRPSLRSLASEIPVRRALSAAAAFMFVVFLTVMLTGASFASGVAILLHGARAGVFQVHEYPSTLSHVPFPAKVQGDNDRQ